jgi:hypothetical protein
MKQCLMNGLLALSVFAVGCNCCRQARVEDGPIYFLEVPNKAAPLQTLPPPRIDLGPPKTLRPSAAPSPSRVKPIPQDEVRLDKMA